MESGVGPSLHDSFHRRYPPVVITEVDDPIPLVETVLAALSRSQILLGLLPAQPVDNHEML